MFKMRVLCCACFLIVAAVPVSAQTINATSGWVWQNPWPQGNNLNGVFLLDSRNIFAVGDNGRFMKSSDGGATWTVDNLESPILKSIFCTNTNTCIALGFDHTRAGVYQT